MSESETIPRIADCPPTTSILLAMKNQNLSWKDCLCELVDNSLDAGADRIEISISGKTVSVIDNGRGIEKVEHAVTLGLATRHPGTKLGRYGMGLKDAATSFWGTTTIVTTHKGKAWQCSINWNKQLESGSWKFNEHPIPNGDFVGTRLLFEKIQKGSPPSYEDLINQISFTFFPAIGEGKQIVLEHSRKRDICRRYEFPPLEGVLDETFEIVGKKVHLRVGTVSEKQKNPKPGFIYVHEHRVIDATGTFGAKDCNISRVFGIVALGKNWGLSKNKNGISDEESQLLEEEIYRRSLTVLERSKRQSMHLELEELSQKAQARVGEEIDSAYLRRILTNVG